MSSKEATARIKINHLLEEAGWRFFADEGNPSNIRLEPSVTIKPAEPDAMGENFEKTSKGLIDLDASGFSLLVLEAKSEDKNPLVGKEQARKYAKSQNCRFVILSNGNLHYFGIWIGATRTSLLHFQRPLPSPATSKSNQTRSALSKKSRDTLARNME